MFIHQEFQSTVHSSPNLNLCFGIALTQVHNAARVLVELHEVGMSPPLKTERVPLDGISYL